MLKEVLPNYYWVHWIEGFECNDSCGLPCGAWVWLVYSSSSNNGEEGGQYTAAFQKGTQTLNLDLQGLPKTLLKIHFIESTKVKFETSWKA